MGFLNIKGFSWKKATGQKGLKPFVRIARQVTVKSAVVAGAAYGAYLAAPLAAKAGSALLTGAKTFGGSAIGLFNRPAVQSPMDVGPIQQGMESPYLPQPPIPDSGNPVNPFDLLRQAGPVLTRSGDDSMVTPAQNAIQAPLTRNAAIGGLAATTGSIGSCGSAFVTLPTDLTIALMIMSVGAMIGLTSWGVAKILRGLKL